jgi:hypothetical protein
MKKFTYLLLAASLTFSASSHAEESWFDSFKSMLGFGDSAEEVAAQALPSVDGMLGALTENLGVTSEQAEGGLASIMNYLKNNVSSESFGDLSASLPGLDQILSEVPDIKDLGSSDAISGLLNKASEYSDSLKGINELKQQFEALGLKPEMITDFIEQAKAYLDTEQGQEAKRVLSESLSSLI